MKVNGQLEVAQLEQIANSSPTPTPTGRMYIDVTNAANGIPRVYNGSEWLPFSLGQNSALISQNSGSACTVDWSQGLFQQVVLTGNCVISFVNPVAGSRHILVVSQNSTTTLYCYTLNMIDQDTKRGPYQPQRPIVYKANRVYEWFYDPGVRAGIATIPVGYGPATQPSSAVTGMDLSNDMATLVYGKAGSPFHGNIQVSDIFQGAISPLGVTGSASLAAAAAQAIGVSFGIDGKSVFLASGTTPYLQTGLTYQNQPTTVGSPGSTPAGAANCVNIHPTGFFVGCGHASSPFMSIFPYSGTALGTKLTNPVSLPAAAVTGLAFSPQGDYLAAASQTSPYIQVWAFTEAASTGTIGAISANPGSLPAGGPAGSLGRAIAWRPQGDYIAMAMTTTPYLYVVPFNRATGTFGTALTISAQVGALTSVAWTPDGQYLLAGSGTSPYFLVYDFSSASIGSTISFDSSNPGAQVNEIVVHPCGDYCFLGLNTTPYLMAYTLPSKTRNYLRLS